MREEYKNLSFFCDSNDGLESWLVNRYDCALYKLDYLKMEAPRIADLPRDGVIREQLYTHIIEQGDFLGIIPQNCFRFCVYNKIDGSIIYLDLPVEHKYGGYNSIGGIAIENRFYFFSCYSDMAAFCYDSGKDSLRKLEGWNELWSGYGRGEGVVNSVCNYLNGVIFGISGTEKVLYYDLVNDICETFIALDNARIKSVYVYDDLIYISQVDGGEIVIVDPLEKKEVNRISISSDFGEMISLFFDENYIYAIPRYGHTILRIDSCSYSIVEIDANCVDLLNYHAETNRFFSGGKVVDNSIFLFPYNTNALVEIDKNSLKAFGHTIRIDRDEYTLEQDIYRGYDMVFFEQDISLKSYISIIGNSN